MPGGAWWVEDSSGILSRGAFGEAALEPRPEPTSPSVPYDLASLTKPLCTAMLAVLLEQDGRWSLDAPIESIVDELSGSPYGSQSLLALGSHCAGFPAWRPLYLSGSTLARYLATLARLPPLDPPGQAVYSDLGFIALGAAIERVAHEPLDRLFECRIARPLGLPRLGFSRSRHDFRDAAPTERGNLYERKLAGEAGVAFAWRSEVIRGEAHDVNAHHLGGVAGHAGLFGALADVVAVAREILRPGVLALAQPARRRLLDAVPDAPDRTFGLVLAPGSEAARGILPDTAVGHVGFTGTSLWLDPGRDRIYVLLSNRVHPEVSGIDFQAERREFHRIASRLTGANSGRPVE
jgi:CubicO group peptidase (beta-lactamase class C family)